MLNVIAFLLRMVPVAYLLSDRAAALIPRFSQRFGAALLYVLLPNSSEVHGNVTNAQWNLAPVACLILLCGPPAGLGGKIVDVVFLALVALTGPPALLLAPVVILHAAWIRRKEGSSWRRTVAGLLLLGAAAQGLSLATHPPAQRFSLAHLLDIGVGDLARLVAGHAVFDVLLGVRLFTTWKASFGLPAHLAGLLLLAGLAAVTWRRREWPLLLMLYLAMVTVALSLVMPSNDLKLWLTPYFGVRYYYYVALFVVFASARLAFVRGGARWLGIACLAPILCVAIPTDFLYLKQYDTRFADQMAVFRSLPPGERYAFPIYPTGWGMSLTKKAGSSVAANPFAALPYVRKNPLFTLDAVKLVRVLGGGAEDYVTFSGTAADPESGRKAGGVVILAGRTMYPATYGTVRAFPTSEINGPYETFFSRSIPLAAIRAARREVYVAVLSTDRTHFFSPYGPVPNLPP